MVQVIEGSGDELLHVWGLANTSADGPVSECALAYDVECAADTVVAVVAGIQPLRISPIWPGGCLCRTCRQTGGRIIVLSQVEPALGPAPSCSVKQMILRAA